jgi:hypothetical protein
MINKANKYLLFVSDSEMGDFFDKSASGGRWRSGILAFGVLQVRRRVKSAENTAYRKIAISGWKQGNTTLLIYD